MCVCVWIRVQLCMHTLVCIHVNMSGGNHKSAEPENLWPVI